MTRVSRAKLTYLAVLFLIGLTSYWILTGIQNTSLIGDPTANGQKTTLDV